MKKIRDEVFIYWISTFMAVPKFCWCAFLPYINPLILWIGYLYFFSSCFFFHLLTLFFVYFNWRFDLLRIPRKKIKKAVRFFARKLTAETKKTINLYLELIRFRMRSTFISFDSDYYDYSGGEKEEQWLAIGGYELAFLSNLVAY